MSADDPFSHLIGRPRRDPREAAVRLAKPEPALGAVERDPRHYLAFETEQRPDAIDIRCAGPSHMPGYGALLNVIYDRHFWRSAILVYSYMTVTLTGRNLASVLHAIRMRHCAALTEFSAKEHDAPEAGAPFIERIEIQAGKVVEGLTERVASSDRSG